MDELFVQIQKLIADKLEIDADKITLDSSFRQDLGADSLDTYELVYAIEEEMGKELLTIATGGLAKLVVPYCKKKIVVDDSLLIKGLGLIYEKNRI